jgi:hypothetical protein
MGRGNPQLDALKEANRLAEEANRRLREIAEGGGIA